MQLNQVTKCQKDRLFSGAIDLDWFVSNHKLSSDVAKAYVFHGPRYHSMAGQDIVSMKGKRIIDSITLLGQIVMNLSDDKLFASQKISLIIAGYGTGKSHFSLMLSELLSRRNKSVVESIFSNIMGIEPTIAEKLRDNYIKLKKGVLVIPINGLDTVDLFQKLFKTTHQIIKDKNLDLSPFNSFDPRFASLYNALANHKDEKSIFEILKESGFDCLDDFKHAMDNFDEKSYLAVLSCYKAKGFSFYPPAANGEIKGLLKTLDKAYCGSNKPFDRMLLVFDEFGKYLAMASENSLAAGSGVLQLLQEGIVDTSNVAMIGLSQLDLKEYAATVTSLAGRNDIQRYVTRYDMATKYYMSADFISIVASLLESDKDYVEGMYQKYWNDYAIGGEMSLINSFFPSSGNYPVWNNKGIFAKNILLGCWPISPFALWMLHYISSESSVLQQRSAFGLLINSINSNLSRELSDDNFQIYAVDIYREGLDIEFLNSEREFGTGSSDATDLEAIIARYGAQFKPQQMRLLCAIVIANKLMTRCMNINSLHTCLSRFSGLSLKEIEKDVESLSCDQFNVIQFDSSAKRYSFISEGATYREFVLFLAKKRIEYGKINNRNDFEAFLPIYQKNPECITNKAINERFGLSHNIATTEWIAEKRLIDINSIETVMKSLQNSLPLALSAYDSKGCVLYTYLNPNIQKQDEAEDYVKRLLQKYGVDKNGIILPIVVVLLNDIDCLVINDILSFNVLSSLSKTDAEKYASFINKEKDRLMDAIIKAINKLALNRIYLSLAPNTEQNVKIRDYLDQLYEIRYPNVVSFPIDGFAGSDGVPSSNGFASCKEFIRVLCSKTPNWNYMLKMQTVNVNRAKALFINSWQSISDSGRVCKPGDKRLQNLFARFDEIAFESDKTEFSLGFLYILAMLPPYGLNASSASLAIALYYALNSSFCGMNISGELYPESLSQLIQETKNSYSVKLKGFDDRFLCNVTMYKKIDKDVEWNNWLNEYTNSTTYLDLVEIHRKMKKLVEQHIKTPENVVPYILESEKKSTLAIAKLTEYKSLLDEAEQSYKRVIITKHGYRSFVNKTKNLYVFSLNEVNNLDDFGWAPTQRDNVSEVLEEYFTTIRNEFDDWIENHKLSLAVDCQQITNEYRDLIGVLKELKLNDFVDNLKRLLDEYQETRKLMLDYRSFKFNNDNELKSLVSICQSVSRFSSDEVKNTLQRCRDLKDKYCNYDYDSLSMINKSFNAQISQLDDLISSLSKIIERNEQILTSLYNTELASFEDLQIVYKQIDKLKIYYEDSSDGEDLDSMKKELDLLFSIREKVVYATGWTDLNKIKKEVPSLLNMIEDPIWIYEDVVNSFFETREAFFMNESSRLVKNAEMEFKSGQAISDSYYFKIRYTIDNPVLDDSSKKRLSKVLLEVDKEISKNKVDTLVAQYKKLSNDEKKIFMKNIND